MRQDKLFYDTAMDSIRDAISDSGLGYKKVATHLWPSKKPDTAYGRIKNCLNDDKDEKFDFGEIIEICKFTGRCDPLYFMADELSHTRGEPKAPEDEAAILKKEFVSGVKSLEKLAERLERL